MRQKTDQLVGVVAGAGVHGGFLDKLYEKSEFVSVKSPFSKKEVLAKIGTIGGREVAFVPRHGWAYDSSPHKLDYLSNFYCLKKMGVELVVAFFSTGGINYKYTVGELVILDSFLDFTKSRVATFYDSIPVFMLMLDAFDKDASKILASAAKKSSIKIHHNGTYACMEGPRYETGAEIRMLRGLGADLVGLSLVPEPVLAKELGMGYAAVAGITNTIHGKRDDSFDEVKLLETTRNLMDSQQKLFLEALPKLWTDQEANMRLLINSAINSAQLLDFWSRLGIDFSG